LIRVEVFSSILARAHKQQSLTSVAQIRHDTIEEFNMDSKAECDQLNLAHETKTNQKVIL